MDFPKANCGHIVLSTFRRANVFTLVIVVSTVTIIQQLLFHSTDIWLHSGTGYSLLVSGARPYTYFFLVGYKRRSYFFLFNYTKNIKYRGVEKVRVKKIAIGTYVRLFLLQRLFMRVKLFFHFGWLIFHCKVEWKKCEKGEYNLS